MRTFSRSAQSAEPQTPKPIRTAALIRAEHSAAIDSQNALRAKLDEAEDQLAAAKVAFNVDEVQALGPKVDAMRAVLESHDKHIPALAAELADAELAEAIAEGREKLPALAASARAQCDAFEQALLASYTAETTLFSLLFDTKTGLRQGFATEELAREATRVRIELRRRVAQLAERFGHPVNIRFETDGNPNFGPNTEPGFFNMLRRTIGNWQ
jgi:hypothetical protein